MDDATVTVEGFSRPAWGEADGAPVFAAGVPTGHRRTIWQSGLPLDFVGSTPLGLIVSRAVRRKLLAKRAFDLGVGALALVLFAPFLLALAVLVRATTPGPALLRQWRVGQGGRLICVYKFRTMYIERCDDAGLCQVALNDPRITPVGRFLRRFSLDELPQLLNVLRGDMALVGPRPHTAGIRAAGVPYAKLVPYYALRQTLKPGMTGWAQANGLRGPTHDAARARARIDHDLAYMQNFSLRLDIEILLRTLCREVLGGTGS